MSTSKQTVQSQPQQDTDAAPGKNFLGSDPVIGIDFDNTIATYDEVFHAAALEQGLIPAETEAAKLPIRDFIRSQSDGELAWQRLQAEVYGPLMPRAQLIDGVMAFLKQCCWRQVPVFVVSHKTVFARRDETRTNLRKASLTWMKRQGLLDADSTGLSERRVFFEDTRQNKVARIRDLACTHFVDDLVEVFLESGFPDVERVLLSSHAVEPPPPGIRAVEGWDEVSGVIFNA